MCERGKPDRKIGREGRGREGERVCVWEGRGLHQCCDLDDMLVMRLMEFKDFFKDCCATSIIF